jgi:hypothetical protein
VKAVRAGQRRFAEEGLEKFGRVRPVRWRKPATPTAMADASVEATLHTTLLGEVQRSCRPMAWGADFSTTPLT